MADKKINARQRYLNKLTRLWVITDLKTMAKKGGGSINFSKELVKNEEKILKIINKKIKKKEA